MSLTEIFTLTIFVSFMLGYLARDTTLWRSRKDLTKPRGRTMTTSGRWDSHDQ